MRIRRYIVDFLGPGIVRSAFQPAGAHPVSAFLRGRTHIAASGTGQCPEIIGDTFMEAAGRDLSGAGVNEVHLEDREDLWRIVRGEQSPRRFAAGTAQCLRAGEESRGRACHTRRLTASADIDESRVRAGRTRATPEAEVELNSSRPVDFGDAAKAESELTAITMPLRGCVPPAPITLYYVKARSGVPRQRVAFVSA
jgi:hypothetical protein